MRTLALPEAVAQWSLTSLREKPIKIGAKVVRHARYAVFQMAEVAVPRELLYRPPVASPHSGGMLAFTSFPGCIWGMSDKDFMARIKLRIAAGRLGTPADFVGVAAFLASSASDYVTDADIRVDGRLMWGA